jgi:hypothetical protein
MTLHPPVPEVASARPPAAAKALAAMAAATLLFALVAGAVPASAQAQAAPQARPPAPAPAQAQPRPAPPRPPQAQGQAQPRPPAQPAAPAAAPAAAAPADMSVFAMVPAPMASAEGQTSAAEAEREYRADAARHLYAAYPTRVFRGKLPPLLFSVMMVETEIDAQGQVVDVNIIRRPAVDAVAPWVVAMIKRAAPYPVPTKLVDSASGTVRYMDVWLVDRSGLFQVDTLTEGQR